MLMGDRLGQVGSRLLISAWLPWTLRLLGAGRQQQRGRQERHRHFSDSIWILVVHQLPDPASSTAECWRSINIFSPEKGLPVLHAAT